MARIIEGIKETKTLKYTHDAEVSAGDVIVVGGVVLIAVNDAEANEEAVYMFAGRAALPKATGAGEAIDSVAKVYWDGTQATTTATDNDPVGICVEAAGDDDDEVIVDMFATI